MTYKPSALMEEAIGLLEWWAVAGFKGPEAVYKLEAAKAMREGRKPEGRALEVAIKFFKHEAAVYSSACMVARGAFDLRQQHREKGKRLYRLLARLEA